MGDAIIIGLYDSEKEKALNGAAVAEQIQLGTQSLSSIRALSQNEIEQVNAAFAPIVYDKQGNPIAQMSGVAFSLLITLMCET